MRTASRSGGWWFRILTPLMVGIIVSAWGAEPDLRWRLNPLDLDGPIPYFIAPGLESSGYRASDEELAEWALEHWAHAANGVLCFYPSVGTKSLVRIYWSPVSEGRYGQMLSIAVGLRRGGEVYVRSGMEELERDSAGTAERAARDPLFRDAVVYLTLLHEIGHVLGMAHTASINDAMYFGGDPVNYFERYRTRLSTRADIRSVPGLSEADQSRLRRLYPNDFWARVKAAKERSRAEAKRKAEAAR